MDWDSFALKTNLAAKPPEAQQKQKPDHENQNEFFEKAGNYYLNRHTDEMWEAYVAHEMKTGMHAEF